MAKKIAKEIDALVDEVRYNPGSGHIMISFREQVREDGKLVDEHVMPPVLLTTELSSGERTQLDVLLNRIISEFKRLNYF